MTLWISTGVLFVISLVALIFPLLRRRREVADNQELLVYQDQMMEVTRDLERGLLNEHEAGDIRSEITRRVKRLEASSEHSVSRIATQKLEIPVIVGLVFLIPVAAFGIYASIGSPNKEDLPISSRHIASSGATSAEISGATSETAELNLLADNLQKKMNVRPDNLDGWMLLGRTYMTLERWQDAASAFSHAHNLSPAGPDIAASYAEALYMAESTKFTDQTRAILQSALRVNPKDPKLLFYWGLALAQQNKHRAALQTWTNLIAISPTDAPWMPTLRQYLQRSAEASDIDVAKIKPTIRPATPGQSQPTGTAPTNIPGPTREDMEAASQLSADDRMAFIRSMVERLAERLKNEPDDLEGWRRLVRAYQVLGETNKAKNAQARVHELENVGN